MNFKPADTYYALLVQARALHVINEGLSKQRDYLKAENVRLRREALSLDAAAISAERDTNEKLTAALEAAESKIAELRRML